ncbi:MAG: DUF4212 domain-containing protein [Gammaproteobacteria bacterium]|nr:DUF4212 domain-containing protein [Gammaproteobacteria bacterium]
MKKSSHWGDNLRLVAICLVVWFVVSFGCGILFVDSLNRFSIGGFELGFWFAQQGSIVVFLLVIVAYVVGMAVIDRRHGVAESDEAPPDDASSHSDTDE